MRNPDQLVEIAELLRRPMERYLKWEQVCDRFKRGDKSVFGKCFLKAKANNVEERKSLAYTDEEYIKYLSEWDSAEKEKVKAEVEVKNLETNLEALTSALAYDRESMRNKI